MAGTEKYRMARNLKEGMEVQLAGGEWVGVKSTLVITSPMRVTSIDLVNGDSKGVPSDARIMSRYVVQGGVS